MKRIIKAADGNRMYNKMPNDAVIFCDYLWDNYQIDCEVNRDLTKITNMRYQGHNFDSFEAFRHIGGCFNLWAITEGAENVDEIISMFVESEEFKDCYKCMRVCASIYDFLDNPEAMESYLRKAFLSRGYPGIDDANFMLGEYFAPLYWPDVVGVEIHAQYVLTDVVYNGENISLGTEKDCSGVPWGIGPWVYSMELRLEPKVYDYNSLLRIFEQDVATNFGDYLYENIQQKVDIYPESIAWAESFISALNTFLNRKGYELEYKINSEDEFVKSYSHEGDSTIFRFEGLKNLDSNLPSVSLNPEYITVSQIDNEQDLYNRFTKRFTRAIYRNKKKFR